MVVVSFSVLMLALHYFACVLWLVLRVQVIRQGTGSKGSLS
jgi:hypothetical protein